MWQLDRAMGCPDSWWSLLLGVSVRVSLEEISIWISRVKITPQNEWASPNLLRVGREQKGGERANLLLLGEAGTSAFSCLQESELLVLGPWTQIYTSGSSDFQTFQFGLNYTTGVPGSPACRWQIVGLFSFHSCTSWFLMYLFICSLVHVSHQFCSTGKLWIIHRYVNIPGMHNFLCLWVFAQTFASVTFPMNTSANLLRHRSNMTSFLRPSLTSDTFFSLVHIFLTEIITLLELYIM